MSAPIELTFDRGVANFRFARPERLNVLDVAMAQAFQAAVQECLEHPNTRVVMLSGAGRSFMAGGDLSEFHNAEDRPGLIAQVIEPIHSALKSLDVAPVISLCAAQGAVAGAGVSLMMACDLAIAADDASFNMAYARIGATPDCGGTWALPRLVGPRKALELVLLSETVTAQDAAQIGLVNQVVPSASLMQKVEQIAHRLAAGPTAAQLLAKALLKSSMNSTLADLLDAERTAFLACADGQDFAEGLAAFLEKRKPSFHSRLK